jgi:hypothetical protein
VNELTVDSSESKIADLVHLIRELKIGGLVHLTRESKIGGLVHLTWESKIGGLIHWTRESKIGGLIHWTRARVFRPPPSGTDPLCKLSSKYTISTDTQAAFDNERKSNSLSAFTNTCNPVVIVRDSQAAQVTLTSKM